MCSGASGICQTWSRSVECRTVASRRAPGLRAVGGGPYGPAGPGPGGRPGGRRRRPRAGRRCPRRPRPRGPPGPAGSGPSTARTRKEPLEGGQGVGDREAVQQPVDGADPQRVAGGVDEEDQAVVPGAGRGRAPRAAADRSPSGGGRRRSGPGGRARSARISARSAGSVTAQSRWLKPSSVVVARSGARCDGALDDGGRAGRACPSPR